MAILKTVVLLMLLIAAPLHLVASVGEAVNHRSGSTFVSGLLGLVELAATFAVFSL